MKILCLNLGFLRFKFLGFPVKTMVDFINERILATPTAIERINADTVFLQEVYELKHKLMISKSLAKLYPYSFFDKSSKLMGVDNGLMIFSKYPFIEQEFIKLKNKLFEEKIFANKGILSATFKYLGENIKIFNVHFSAGGFTHPESSRANLIRKLQIEETLSKAKNNNNSIIVGDLNCGPEVSQENFKIFENFGFHSCMKTGVDFTWDPHNILNQKGYHHMCPPQTIDHILLSDNLSNMVKNQKLEVVFKDPLLEVKDQKIPLSDHYGIVLTLDI